MQKLIEKASVLIEALPYIKDFFGKTIVIKYGGSAMVDKKLKDLFALDIVLMKYIGMNPVIVHGGGRQIEEVLKKFDKKTQFINGLRVTDSETMEIVEMVLVGKINREIVHLINQHGGRAVGLSGKDGQLIKAKKMYLETINGEEKVDLGLVGRVEQINPEIVEILDRGNFIPVIAPIGTGDSGQAYNINADDAACGIAVGLKAEKLVFLTDVEGIKADDGSLITNLDEEKVQKLIEDQTVTGGMLPKVKAGLKALEDGVKKVHIIDGRVEHTLLLEIFTKEGIGTEIVRHIDAHHNPF
ncbi:MAG: acetylglutamate kinase [bacterium]